MSQVSDHHKLRYEDYVLFPDDGLRHELLDGVHYMHASPIPYHQIASKRIQHQLYTAIELRELGLVFNAPIDVHLAEFDVVVPDFVVLLPANRIVTPTKIKGVPDLLIEILSPSTREFDRKLKRKRYQAAGVPEFWLVDPENHTVEQLVLTDGNYIVRDHDEVVRLAILDQVTVDFSKVW